MLTKNRLTTISCRQICTPLEAISRKALDVGKIKKLICKASMYELEKRCNGAIDLRCDIDILVGYYYKDAYRILLSNSSTVTKSKMLRSTSENKLRLEAEIHIMMSESELT